MTTLTSPMEVTGAQREQLQEQGFFITDVLFDESTLEAARGEFNRMWQEDIGAARVNTGVKLYRSPEQLETTVVNLRVGRA